MGSNPHESPWVRERYLRLYGIFGNSPFSTQGAAQELGGEDVRTVRVFISEMNRAGLIEKEKDPADGRRVLYRFLPAADSIRYGTSSGENPKRRHIRPSSTAGRRPPAPVDEFDGLSDADRDLIYQAETLDLMAAFRVRTLEDLHDFFLLLAVGKLMNMVERSGYEVDITALDLLEGADAPLEELIGVAVKAGLPAVFRSAWGHGELQVFCSRISQRLAGREETDFTPDSFLEDNLPAFVNQFLSSGRYDLDRYFDLDLFLHFYATCYPTVRDALPHAPPELQDLLVRLVNPRPGESVCDPAGCDCIPLLRACRHVWEQEGDNPEPSLFYGQIFVHDPDAPPARSLWYRLCASCLILCSTPGIGVTTGNALLATPFRDLTDLQEPTFDCVISVPPWNLGGYGKERLKKTDAWWRRFSWGVPSGRSADWAFVQVAISLAGEQGRLGVVVDRSALNREGEDEKIRAAIIEDNLIDCVILLPEQICTKAQFQTCNDQCAILLLRKGRRLATGPHDPGEIFFINAQELHEGREDGPSLRRLTGIDRILSTYGRSIEREHFSRRVSLEEVRASANSLDPERYVPGEDGSGYACAALRDLVLDAAWGVSTGSVTGRRVQVVHAGDIDPDGKIIPSSIRRETVDSVTPDDARLAKGDILVSLRNGLIEKVALYEGASAPLYHHQGLLRLRPDPRKVLAPYLLSLLRILKDTRRFQNTDRDSLLRETLDLAIVVPSHSRQAQILQTLMHNPGMQSFIAGLLTTANRSPEIG